MQTPAHRLAAILLLMAPLGAQLLPARQFKASYGPGTLVTGDLDGDGRTDLVTSGYELAVLLRDPAGGFKPPVLYPIDDPVYGVALGHLDGDDALDLVWVTYSFSATTLAWRLGDGSGGFGPVSELPVATYPGEIAIADFDDDGNDDVAVTSLGIDVVSILLSDGAGGLVPSATVPAGYEPSRIDAGDLDGDDAIDLVVTNYIEDTVTVLYGNGAGAFAPAPLAGPDGPQEVLIGDVDEDGDADLLVSGFDPVALFLGHGDGTFAPFQLLQDTGRSLQLADVDGNGFEDLVDIGPDGIRALPGGKGPDFGSPPPGIPTAPLASMLVVLAVDEDGQPDLVVGSAGSTFVNTLRGTGFGEFEGYESVDFEEDPTAFVTADLDGDSDIDVAIAAYGYSDGGGVSVLKNDGAGALGPPAHTDLYSLVDIAAGDVDADGDLDLASAVQYSEVKVQINNGTGTFPHVGTYPVGDYLEKLALGDVDGDGDADLAVEGFTYTPPASSIAVLLADGTGKFATPLDHSVAPAGGLALADIDLDGALDIVTAAKSPGLALVLLGDGTGVFHGLVTSPVPDGTKALAVADLDTDGDPDLVALSYASGATLGALAALHGDGTGGFAVAQSWDVTAFAEGLALADIDDNGWPEILTTERQQAGSTTLLVADGVGGYLPPRSYIAGQYPIAVAVAPLDADARPDVMVLNHSSYENGELTLLRNLGPPEPWTNLGQGKFGVAGIPMLVGHGTLLAGDPLSLELRGAQPQSAATLIVGLAPLFAPLKGGVLVPMPNFVFAGLSTDADGDVLLQADWPGGVPAGLQTWYQFWVADLVGYAASNGVTAVAP